jgi:hypothetical protein
MVCPTWHLTRGSMVPLRLMKLASWTLLGSCWRTEPRTALVLPAGHADSVGIKTVTVRQAGLEAFEYADIRCSRGSRRGDRRRIYEGCREQDHATSLIASGPDVIVQIQKVALRHRRNPGHVTSSLSLHMSLQKPSSYDTKHFHPL